MYLNKVQLIGNLTRDPELKALPSGIQVANFSLATNRSFKNKEGVKQEAVEFHNCVAFGRVAEIIAQYVKKGHQLYAQGRLQTRKWDKDGVTMYRTEVLVENFQFGNKPAGTTGNPAYSEPAVAQPQEAYVDPLAHYFDEEETINPEDIPF